MHFMAHSATATTNHIRNGFDFKGVCALPYSHLHFHATKNARYDLVQYSLTTRGQGQVHSIFHNKTLFENDLPRV